MILLTLAMASAVPDLPLARGSWASVTAATKAARNCGMTNIRFDPLDSQRAVLVFGRGNKPTALDCTLKWMKANWDKMQFEPLMAGNEEK
jgi:hypothetical protein